MMKGWNFFLVIIVLVCSWQSHAAEFQDNAVIKAAVTDRVDAYLLAIYGKERAKEDITFRISNMDSRLKLPHCEVPLHAEPKESGFGSKQLSVKVVCPSGSRWTIYVPVSISIYGEVAISTRNLQRGDKIEQSDFVMKRTNTSTIGQSFVDNADAVIGMVVHRPIRSGSVIKTQDIKEPIVIAKGETITLLANQGALRVSSEGLALSNGKMGEQIRVQNTRSRRIVDARVIGAGRAEVW